MKYDSAKFVVALDLIGIFVFAVEGAMTAIDNDLDLLGTHGAGILHCIGRRNYS